MTLVTLKPGDFYTVQSTLEYKVVKEDMDAHFSCEVSYFVPEAIRTAESHKVKVIIHCECFCFIPLFLFIHCFLNAADLSYLLTGCIESYLFFSRC